jgi:hypothetical protein
VHSFPLYQFLLQKYLVAQPVYFCFVALALELVLLALDGLEVHGHHLPILLRKLQHLRREQSLQQFFLQLDVAHQYAVLFSWGRTVESAKLFHFLCVVLIAKAERILLEDQ